MTRRATWGVLLCCGATTCSVQTGPIDTDDRAALPDIEACRSVSDWDAGWSAWEDALRRAVRDARAERTPCPGQAPLPADLALVRDGHLRCAARLHAQDMAVRDYFDHFDPDTVEGPGDRVRATGAEYPHVIELIAADLSSAAQAIELWRQREKTCADLMDPGVTDVGVGYYGGPEGTYEGYAVLLLAGPGDGDDTGGSTGAP